MPIYQGNTEINTQFVDGYGLGNIFLGTNLVQSGLTADNFISPFSNSAPEVDFYFLEVFKINGKNFRGTSASTVAFSAYWAKNYKGAYQPTYDYMKSISKSAKGRSTTTDRLVSLLG